MGPKTIKHSKYKNTGLIFELLIRQTTSDTLRGIDSHAVNILKKFFSKGQLKQEYKLYESIIKSKSLESYKANILIDTILELSKNINRSTLKNEKYNLIKEIKEHYNIDDFFSKQVTDYKFLASIYTLIECHNSTSSIDPDQIVNNKFTLIEHLSKPIAKRQQSKILEEYSKYDKDLKILTYKIILEKFNSKYQNLYPNQKLILKEYINSLDSNTNSKKFYNSQILEIKEEVLKEIPNIKDPATKIKIQEVLKYLTPLPKSYKIQENNFLDLLQYSEMLEEIKKTHDTNV